MHLTPTEEARLQIFLAAQLAREVLGRGWKLSAPEAIALACDEMHMAARSGATYEEVLTAGRQAVSPSSLIEGVAGIVDEIRLEVVMDEGSRLVVLGGPWA